MTAQRQGDAVVERNERHFDGLVEQEAKHFAWQRSKLESIRRIIGEYAAPAAGAAIADVGCFTGAGLDVFGRGFTKRVGFDASVPALEAAQQRGISTRAWAIHREACPAAHGEFEVVVAADIIEHLVDTDAFLHELRRVLRPRGWLFLTTPNLAFWLSRLRLLGGKPPWCYPTASPTVKRDLVTDANHIRITTRQEWETLFEQRGFAVESVRGYSVLPAIGGIPLRRTLDTWITRAHPNLAFGLLFALRRG